MNAKPFNQEIIRKKLSQIKDYLGDLEKIKDCTIREYQSDIFRKRGIEKTLINLIQAAIDINNYLLVKLKKIAPDDNFDSFVKLGESGILSQELVSQIAPSTGLRSHLVHEYDKIDDTIVHASIKDALDQYPKYLTEINNFLSNTAQEQLF